MRTMALLPLTGFALALAAAIGVAPAPARADETTIGVQIPLQTSSATEFSAQSRKRPLRLRVYRPGYGYLPPTAKRDCTAWYEQEYRPSGTVIVPRMRCRWING